jgi:hypothetical protein
MLADRGGTSELFAIREPNVIVAMQGCQQKSRQNHPFLTRFVLCQFQELRNSQSTYGKLRIS